MMNPLFRWNTPMEMCCQPDSGKTSASMLYHRAMTLFGYRARGASRMILQQRRPRVGCQIRQFHSRMTPPMMRCGCVAPAPAFTSPAISC